MAMTTKKVKLKTLMTSKMEDEEEEQYVVWLLYCDSGSIAKLHRTLSGLWSSIGEVPPEFANLRSNLKNPPALKTLERWSKKYRWVERCELKLAEDLEGIRKKTQEITQKKVGLIAEIFWDKLQTLRRQIKKGECSTVDEIKKLWEMFRTEMGETLGRHDLNFIDESKQKPLDAKDAEWRKEINKTMKILNERERRSRESQHSLLD